MVDMLKKRGKLWSFRRFWSFRPFAREMIAESLPAETKKKSFEKKTFENIWKICNKVLTFATAFRKKKRSAE